MKEKILSIASDLREGFITSNEAKEHLLVLFGVSHSITPDYLDNKYKIKWLINDTYQVKQNENCVYQGSKSDCNEWLKWYLCLT